MNDHAKFITLVLTIKVCSCGAWQAGGQSPVSYSPGASHKQFVTRGRTINVATVEFEPYVMPLSTNSNETKTPAYRGYIVDLLNSIETKTSFRFHIIINKDGNYGHRQPDGTWDGMIGDIISRTKGRGFHPAIHDCQTLAIKSASDLLHQTDIQYGTLNRGIIKKFFKQSNHTIYRSLWQHMEHFHPPVLTDSNEERDQFLFTAGFGLAVQKNSNLLEELNRAIEALDRDGTLHKLYTRWWLQRSECTQLEQVKRKMYRSASSGGQTQLSWTLLQLVTLGLIVCRLS